MKHLLIYMTLAFALLSSCTKQDGEVSVTRGEVYMNISTSSLDPSMTELRIIVTDASSGQVLVNEYPATRENTGNYRLTVRSGELNFYVLLNEPGRLTPQLDALKRDADLRGLVIEKSELPFIETPSNSTTQTSLPALGHVKALVRGIPGQQHSGEASTDGGATWLPTLDIRLERLAAKVSFAVRKKTPVDSDNLKINSIKLLRVPRYGFILPGAYTSAEFDTPVIYDTPVEYPVNFDNYIILTYIYIVPEYLPANPLDQESALTLEVDAQYNGRNVLYKIPVRASLEKEDYSIKRNNHYMVKATITTEGEVVYIPEVKYQVAEWTDVDIESEFMEQNAITFSQRWASGTDINDNKVLIGDEGYVEFHFTLSHPKGASWAATLTNSVDFMFDYGGGAVSSGITREGKEYIIRIKPRREASLNERNTGFFITVNNGLGNVELDLPGGLAGAQNRYTVIQLPE